MDKEFEQILWSLIETQNRIAEALEKQDVTLEKGLKKISDSLNDQNALLEGKINQFMATYKRR